MQKVHAQVPTNRLKMLLEAHDLRPVDVATVCNVDSSTVSRWAKGQTIPRKKVLLVAEMFGVSVPFLDGWTDHDDSHARQEQVA